MTTKKLTIALLLAWSLSSLNTAVASGIPVFDGANVSQTTMTAFENIAQTLKQIQQYKTQLEQYENMLQNTKNLENFNWGNVNQTITQLQNAMQTLSKAKQQLGSVEAYVSKYENLYKNHPCFTSSNCSVADKAALKQNMEALNDYKKSSNSNVLKGIENQLNAIQTDASTLKKLQSGAQDAEGQMEALQYANQINSLNAAQTMQLRKMLLQQAEAQSVRSQEDYANQDRARERAKQLFKRTK